ARVAGCVRAHSRPRELPIDTPQANPEPPPAAVPAHMHEAHQEQASQNHMPWLPAEWTAARPRTEDHTPSPQAWEPVPRCPAPPLPETRRSRDLRALRYK